MKLMIVESPNKIKKISAYLGNGWLVGASVGHIRDLPNNEMGICPPHFKPQYVISQDKKKVVANLKNLVSRVDEVYLACDPDREGEAISYHLKEVLKLDAPFRVTFSEITKTAIEKALANAGTIDMELVRAQEGRRVLDRIVGYTMSPILSKQAGIALSAGRVQSPAIKIVVLREREISEFRARNYYSVSFLSDSGLTANLDVKPWADNGKHIFDKECAIALTGITACEVTEAATDDKEIKPRKALMTSTLQQFSSKVFGYSPGDTMKLAQSLFEQGAITYHRTDSDGLSEDATRSIQAFLNEAGFETGEGQKSRKNALAQEAHEAIRPTDIGIVEAGTTEAERNLYGLIRERALISCASSGIDTVTSVELCSIGTISYKDTISLAKFKATGTVIKSLGWRKLVKYEQVSDKKTALSSVPKVGEILTGKTSQAEKKTEPPSRFTEASLIKALEKLGIGRPSTYASIMENIKGRGYIKIQKSKAKEKTIFPTEKGVNVVDALSEMTFMNFDYTKRLEAHLDQIASGKANYLSLINEVYENIDQESKSIKILSMVKTTDCPKCGLALKQLSKKKGRATNYFWVHCEDNDNCHKFIDDNNGEPLIKESKTSPCPKCQEPLVQRYSKAEEFHFWTHLNEGEQECSNFIKDVDGSPALE